MLKRLAMIGVLLTIFQGVPPLPEQTATRPGNGGGEANANSQNKNGRTAPLVAVADSARPPENTEQAAKVTTQEGEHSVTLTSVPPLTIKDRQKTFLDHVYDWGPWFFGLILAIAGGLQLWLLRITWKAIQEQKAEAVIQTGILKDSAAAAQASANAAIAQIEMVKSKERARLSIEFDPLLLVYDQSADGYPVRFKVVLDGITRATIEHESIIAYLADAPIRRASWEPIGLGEVFRPEDSPFTAAIFIQSEDESDPFNERESERIRLLKDRKLDVYVTGKIIYQDIFGERWELGVDRIWHQWSSLDAGEGRGAWSAAGNGEGEYHRKAKPRPTRKEILESFNA